MDDKKAIELNAIEKKVLQVVESSTEPIGTAMVGKETKLPTIAAFSVLSNLKNNGLIKSEKKDKKSFWRKA